MEIVEQLRDRLSKELSRLPPQFRLMLLSIGVGVVAGLGAILFDRLLGWTLHTVLEPFTGYAEPGAGSPAASLFTVAPEAEGHGTDAMIDAFHHRGGEIRKRVPFVKILASVLTIGTGGSAGKEGTIAYAFPQVSDGGYGWVQMALEGKMLWWTMLLLASLPQAPLAGHDEVLGFLESEKLHGKGVGWIDIHLLVSARIARSPIWTLDRRLSRTAESLSIGS